MTWGSAMIAARPVQYLYCCTSKASKVKSEYLQVGNDMGKRYDSSAARVAELSVQIHRPCSSSGVNTSAYVSIRQHTSAYVSIRQRPDSQALQLLRCQYLYFCTSKQVLLYPYIDR
jgi:hypothetical protein